MLQIWGMANRKLVEIFPKNYRALHTIKALNRKAKRPGISIPFLVNEAIEKSLDRLKREFTPL